MIATADVAFDLDERIAAAFQDGANSGDVSELIKEAEAAVVASGEIADEARRRALDPALPVADVTAARRDIDDAAFRRDRLQTAVQKLVDRQRELEDHEEQARRQVGYEKLMAERDAPAEELAQVYPPLALQLADLLKRIEENDRQIEFMNRSSLPKGQTGFWWPSWSRGGCKASRTACPTSRAS